MLNQLHQLLLNQGPKLLKHPVAMMPFVAKQQFIQKLLNAQFKQALEEGDLDFLENRWLKVEVRDLDLIWFVSHIDNQLVVSRLERHDVLFSGEMNDLILIATRRQDPDTLFFQRRLIVEGDTELGLHIKNLMDSIDFDTMPKPLQATLNYLADFVEKQPS